MKYSLYKQAAAVIKQAAKNAPLDLVVEEVPEQPASVPAKTKNTHVRPQNKQVKPRSNHVTNTEPVLKRDTTTNPEPFVFPGYSETTEYYDNLADMLRSEKQELGTMGKVWEYGLHPTLNTAIIGDALSRFWKPKESSPLYRFWKPGRLLFDPKTYIGNAARARALGKLFNAGFNAPFAVLDPIRGYNHGVQIFYPDEAARQSTGYAIMNGGARAVQTTADAVSGAAAAGHLMQLSPWLARTAANARWYNPLAWGANATPYFTPALAIQLAGEWGEAERERLLQGVEILKALNEKAQEISNAHLSSVNAADADSFEDGQTLMQQAPATHWYMNRVENRAAKYEPVNISPLKILWRHPIRTLMGDGTVATELGIEGAKRLNQGFPTTEELRNDPKEQEILPDHLKAKPDDEDQRGKDPDDELYDDTENITGAQAINRATMENLNSRQHTTQGAVLDAHNAGKPKVVPRETPPEKSYLERAGERASNRSSSGMAGLSIYGGW